VKRRGCLELEFASLPQKSEQKPASAIAALQQRASEGFREKTGFETDSKELDGFDCRPKCDPKMTGKCWASSERIALSNIELDTERGSLQLGKEGRSIWLPRSASKLENPRLTACAFRQASKDV
jgi:hypothetical protein